MIEVILPAIIAILIMFGFTFFILRNTVKKINNSAKKYFVDNMQGYNHLVEEKQEELERLRKELEEAKKKVKVAKEVVEEDEDIFSSEIEEKLARMREYKAKQGKLNEIRNEIIYDVPTPEYREENFFSTYKELKKHFDIDSTKVLKEFIEKHKNTREETRKYNILKKFKSQFKENTIYECLTLTGEEQYQLIEEVLDDEEKSVIDLERFRDKSEFSVVRLLSYVDEEITKYDPIIYVFVGKDDLSYDNLNKRIRTCFYKNMSEGVIINYKGKIYDYSI